jgi:hypothetical protein
MASSDAALQGLYDRGVALEPLNARPFLTAPRFD